MAVSGSSRNARLRAREDNKRRLERIRRTIADLRAGYGLPLDASGYEADFLFYLWNNHQREEEQGILDGFDRWLVKKFREHERFAADRPWTLPDFKDFWKDPNARSLMSRGPLTEDETLLPNADLWHRDTVTGKGAAELIDRSPRWVRELVSRGTLKAVGHGQRKRITTASIRKYLDTERKLQ